ncbi:helix-turn-helix transcriptional regulator [Shinella sp.]|uniref:helix-turn-helix transcriptional regulator n=1 Tax=Shinella sp. TaxID=1870904 RepID=UPI00258431AE|nr:helix-turn-helix transcriptional regulator [Shinella sp.]MCW5710716.1 helix-turn-helix transcriptional regulator [Shinella sp.]
MPDLHGASGLVEVDRIYEAALIPALWPSALQTICDSTGSASSSIIVFDDTRRPRFTGTDLIRDVLHKLDEVNAWGTSVSMRMVQEAPPPCFLLDEDYFPADILDGDPLRRPLILQHGMGAQIGTLFPLPTGEKVLITFERWKHAIRPDPRQFAHLDSLRPHLARAGVIAARLGLERAEASVLALEAVGMPAAVINGDARVVASNSLLESMSHLFVSAAHGRLAIADPAAAILFREAIALNGSDQVVRSIPVRLGEDGERYVVHLLPLRREARDIFTGAEILVVASSFEATGSGVPLSILTSLFDLTPSEANLAKSLASGMTLRNAANRCGLTFGSARTYLERIYRKTGINSQSQLVLLLSAGPPFPPVSST